MEQNISWPNPSPSTSSVEKWACSITLKRSKRLSREEMVAREMGLQVLAAQAIEHRGRQGLPIPQALVAVAEAHTFHDLLRI